MATKRNKIAALAIATVMGAGTAGMIALTGCVDPVEDPEGYTYHTYTSTLPSNWNALTYQDANDRAIIDYTESLFFEFDFKFDEAKGGKFKDGKVNADAIDNAGYESKYSAATKIEDVTSTVDAKWGYTAAQKEKGGYAWKITLRDDLKWDDGTAIKAGDFVYSMQEQLSPDFFNFRASSYYLQTRVHNARRYLYSKTQKVYDLISYPAIDGTTITDSEAQIKAAVNNYPDNVYIDVYKAWGAEGYVTQDGKVTSQYIKITDETVYNTPNFWQASEERKKEYADFMSNKEEQKKYQELQDKANQGEGALTAEEKAQYDYWNKLKAEVNDDEFTAKDVYELYLSDNTAHSFLKGCLYYQHDNIDFGFSFNDVGLYAENDTTLVLCLDESIEFADEDGLKYYAPYMLRNLPLVKKDLYEECKQRPVQGSTLWTTNYNTSVETSASWGPYKLATYQGGKSYTLVKNDNWFGYQLDEYKDQYQVTKIECEKMTEREVVWASFFNGTLDGVALDTDHKDYTNSKYAYYSAGTGVFGTNIYSNKEGLKRSGRNNTILANEKFRKAISLFLNRDEYNQTLSTSNKTCYGLISLSGFYDVEEGLRYSDTKESKEALLSVYGFTKNGEGKWTSGGQVYNTVDEAFSAMNGYDPVQAKKLVNEAYEELIADNDSGYDPTKSITIMFGSSELSTGAMRYYNYWNTLLTELVKGTKLEGKIVLDKRGFGKDWSTSFKNGEYDLAPGTGFSGNPLDPFDFIGVYCDPSVGLMYSTWWNTASEQLAITLPTVAGFAQSGQTLTMSIQNWYQCLNGIAESNGMAVKHDFKNNTPSEVRLAILAKLEETILGKYYVIQTTSEYTGELLGAQFSYIIEEENTFIGFGGLRYLKANYNNKEWADFVNSNNRNLSNFYKKSN